MTDSQKLVGALIYPSFLGSAMVWFAQGLSIELGFKNCPTNIPHVELIHLGYAAALIMYLPVPFFILQKELNNYFPCVFFIDCLEVVIVFSAFFFLGLVFECSKPILWVAVPTANWARCRPLATSMGSRYTSTNRSRRTRRSSSKPGLIRRRSGCATGILPTRVSGDRGIPPITFRSLVT